MYSFNMVISNPQILPFLRCGKPIWPMPKGLPARPEVRQRNFATPDVAVVMWAASAQASRKGGDETQGIIETTITCESDPLHRPLGVLHRSAP